MKRYIIMVKDNRCNGGMNARAIYTDSITEARKFAKKYQNKAITGRITIDYNNVAQSFKISDFLEGKVA
ncbi:MAG: hypothetical protein MJ168_08195 [Clostridia bacterium]|nr:hypothetical protein [Clostridia bacterium]